MATIGRITVAFDTELADLNRGIDEAIDRFDEITEAIESLSNRLDDISDRTVTITARANTDAAARAIESAAAVEDLSTEIEVTANAAPAEEEVRRSSGRLSQFWDSFTSSISRSERVVNAASQGMGEYGESVAAVASSTSSVRSSVESASTAYASVGNAIAGLSSAVTAFVGGQASLIQAVDASIVAAGRLVDAYTSVGDAYQTTAATAAALSGVFAGVSTISAAAAGSTAAAAISVGSFASAVTGAAAAAVTYSAIVAVARAATSGLSDESRAYVDTAASVVGGLAAAAVGARAAAASYSIVADAVYRSSSAGEFFVRVFSGLNSAALNFTRTAAGLAGGLGVLLRYLNLISAASQEGISAAGYAAVVAEVTATTAAFGALSAALGAVATGAPILSASIAGATASIGALVASITTVAPLAITAATASGRFSDELERIGKQAGVVEKLADRFGAPNDEIQRLVLAADNADVSIGQLAKSQQNLFASVSKIKVGQINVDSVREAKLSFDRLGISLETIQRSDPQQIFGLVAQEIGKITDPADRAAIAMDLFGRQGVNILPALKDFRELAEDFKRLGGAVNDVDLERFNGVDKSFDRLNAATARLGKTLAIPFVESQRAINNFGAEIRGGLIAALEPVASLFADLSRPIAAFIEVLGRIFNIIGRIIGVFTSLATAITPVKTVAVIFEAIGDGILAVLAPLEAVIGVIEEIGAAFVRFFGTTPAAISAIAKGVGVLVGALVGLATVTAGLAAGAAAAWAVYTVAMRSATIQAAAAAVQFAITWVAALGPVGAVVAGVLGVGAALYGLYSMAAPIADLFTDIGRALGFVGESRQEIDAVTASTEELAEAVARRREQEGETASVDFNEDRTARGEFDARDTAGTTFGAGPQVSESATDYEKIRASIQNARDTMGGLVIESARFGQAGADAAESAQKSFNDLQQRLADGRITTTEFNLESQKVSKTLRENLDILRDDSPQAALRKNLELYKSLNDAAKAAGKSIRDISAGTVVEDKLFPASQEIKRKAAEYRDEYVKALQDIQKRTQSGEFTNELNARRQKAFDDYQSGAISREQYQTIKLDLDSTNAQEQAAIAAEDARRTFDRQLDKIGRDISFADSIRKELETAFLSPVEKFQKELQKIRDNKSLSAADQGLAEENLRRQAREGLVGKTDSQRFQERQRDLQQGAAQGLISPEELNIELKRNADSLAQALGIPVEPASSLDVALGRLQEAVEDGSISMDQFVSGAKEARTKFLESLGVSRRPEDADRERLQRLDQNSQRMSPEEYARGRRELESSIVGESVSDRIASQRQRIEAGIQSGAVGQGRGQAALRRLDAEGMQAAGLELSSSQQLQLGIDKVQEAFNVAGKSLAQIESELSPERFAEYQKAIENTQEAVQSAIVGESSARRFAKQRQAIDEGIRSGAVDPDRGEAALRRIDAEQMQAAGLEVSPGLQLQMGVDRIQDAFNVAGLSIQEIQKKLSPEQFEQYQQAIRENKDAIRQNLGVEKSGAEQIADNRRRLAKAVEDGVITEEEKNKEIKEQRDALLSSLGVEKSPTEQFESAVEEINRNAAELSDAELAEALESAKDKLLDALGIETSPTDQFTDRMDDLNEALSKGRISQEEFAKGAQAARNTLLQSLGIPLDPAEELKRKMKDLQEAFDAGKITAKELARGQEEAKKGLPGGEPDNPVVQFQRDMEVLRDALRNQTIDMPEFNQRRLNLQAQLQEDLLPQIDLLQADRRQVQGSDVRSREGVDTFFRLVQGQDNPSLKAQLEVARNTRTIAQALAEPDAAPVIAQLPAR